VYIYPEGILNAIIKEFIKTMVCNKKEPTPIKVFKKKTYENKI
jgi:hypothetical protein